MQSLNIDFLKNAAAAGPGAVFQNERYNLLIAQIEGSFTGLSLVLEGRTEAGTGPWETISGWSMSDMDARLPSVTDVGIYEYGIENVRELRFRVLALASGSVSAVGVLYDSASGTTYPYNAAPSSIQFGDPNLFVKGVAEQIFFDPSSGNIVGYDKTAAEGSVSITANLAEISGGMGNQLIGVLPDTARVSGTYSSAAFSLETRERIMGGEIAYDAVAQVCETITADSETIAVSQTPVSAIAEDHNDPTYWCYVHHVGDGRGRGENVGVDPDGTVNFVAEPGERYEVTYFCHKVSAQMLPIPTVWNPVMMTVQERYGVYAKQGGSTERGSLRGWLTFIVPRAILNADAGVNASQTTNADTSGNWIALPEKPENMPMCACSEDAHPLAYYVYVPCSGVNDAVSSVVSVGSGLTLKAGRTEQLPIKLVMPDDSLVQPDFATLGYYSDNDAVATVDNAGVVTAVSEGETVIRAVVYKSDGSQLSCGTVVVVEGIHNMLTANRNNIIVN